ncbi:MAG: LptF/LptG family permease [Chlamydiota bacterium]
MPIFWRHLLKKYFKVLFLCVSTFILILLLTRIKEIARFSALSPSHLHTLKFTLLQIPHILPFAVPISCFLSIYLLFDSLSQSCELIAYRSCGIGLKKLMAPVLLMGVLLSSINFFISAELSPLARLKSRELLIEKTSINPIQLLKRQHLLKIKDSFINFNSNDPLFLENLILLLRNKDQIALLTAKEVYLKDKELIGLNASLLSFNANSPKTLQHTILENYGTVKSSAKDISHLMKKSKWNINPSALPLKIMKMQSRQSSKLKTMYLFELIRRISLALSVFTFSYVGVVMGINITRSNNKKRIFTAFVLLSFIFVGFLSAKGFKNTPYLFTTYLLGPQIVVYFAMNRYFQKLEKGISS